MPAQRSHTKRRNGDFELRFNRHTKLTVAPQLAPSERLLATVIIIRFRTNPLRARLPGQASPQRCQPGLALEGGTRLVGVQRLSTEPAILVKVASHRLQSAGRLDSSGFDRSQRQ
jgi:hypothetical protein